MAKNDFQYSGWNFYTLQCGTIMTLISPGAVIMAEPTARVHRVYLMNVERRQAAADPRLHPAMWHVALESWQWIHQVATPCSVIRGSGMTWHWIRPNVRHIEILHLVSISTTSPQSTWHSAPDSEVISKSDHSRQKKMTSCRFSRWRISAILDFMDPIK